MILRLAAVASLLLLTACAPDKAAAPKSAGLIAINGAPSTLKVNGEAVPEALIGAYARKVGWDMHDPGQRSQVNQQLGELVAVAQEARKRGLLDDESVRADLELERLNRLSGLLIERAQSERPITDAELQAAYTDQLNATGTEEYLLAHVLVDTADRAQQIISALAAGTSFDDVLSSQAGQSGVRDAKDLGWVRRPQLPVALAEAVAALESGSYTSSPVATDFGFHVAYLREKRAFAAPGFEQLREGIRDSLERQRGLELAAQIKQASKIEK